MLNRTSITTFITRSNFFSTNSDRSIPWDLQEIANAAKHNQTLLAEPYNLRLLLNYLQKMQHQQRQQKRDHFLGSLVAACLALLVRCYNDADFKSYCQRALAYVCLAYVFYKESLNLFDKKFYCINQVVSDKNILSYLNKLAPAIGISQYTAFINLDDYIKHLTNALQKSCAKKI